MNIIYEKATEEDAKAIRYSGAYSWKETYTGLVPDDYLDYRTAHYEDKVDREKELIRDINNNYYVAKVDDKTVGFVLYGKSDNEQYKDYGYVGALYLLNEYQGLGIGKELFRIALEGLKELGYSKMMLECMRGNNTLNFYKKYSGEVVDEMDYPLNAGKISVKADIMVFDIDEALKVMDESKNKLK